MTTSFPNSAKTYNPTTAVFTNNICKCSLRAIALTNCLQRPHGLDPHEHVHACGHRDALRTTYGSAAISLSDGKGDKHTEDGINAWPVPLPVSRYRLGSIVCAQQYSKQKTCRVCDRRGERRSTNTSILFRLSWPAAGGPSPQYTVLHSLTRTCT